MEETVAPFSETFSELNDMGRGGGGQLYLFIGYCSARETKLITQLGID